MRVLVVIPTYNELGSLPLTLDRLRAAVPTADVLVVDDGSPDGTGELADSRAAADSSIQVMHRTEKRGLGPAYLAGFSWALEHGYEVIVEMDADGSHRAVDLPAILDRIDADPSHSADLVLGSRWIPGGHVQNWPWHRQLLSRGGCHRRRHGVIFLAASTPGSPRASGSHGTPRTTPSSPRASGSCRRPWMVHR